MSVAFGYGQISQVQLAAAIQQARAAVNDTRQLEN
jgi:hypothetical protein